MILPLKFWMAKSVLWSWTLLICLCPMLLSLCCELREGGHWNLKPFLHVCGSSPAKMNQQHLKNHKDHGCAMISSDYTVEPHGEGNIMSVNLILPVGRRPETMISCWWKPWSLVTLPLALSSLLGTEVLFFLTKLTYLYFICPRKNFTSMYTYEMCVKIYL